MFRQILTDVALRKWEGYTSEHPNGITIADNPALFYFYQKFLSLPAYYIFLKNGNKVEGLFSTVKAGRVYISLPHFTYGGIHWFTEKKSSVNPILIEKLVASLRADQLQPGFYEADYLKVIDRPGLDDPKIEVRSADAFYSTGQADKVVNIIKLNDSENIDLDFFKPDVRRKIRKASKSGIIVKKGAEELLGDFTSVYNRNMHRKGSPTLGKQFFAALLTSAAIHTELFVAYKDKLPVGGAFSMWYNGYYENIWFSTLTNFNTYYVSYLLHWEMIKSAVDKKVHTYSMGRSSIGSGTHKYKMQWSTEEIYLYFSTNCPGPAKVKKIMWASTIWKHLPAWFVDRTGPPIAKRIY